MTDEARRRAKQIVTELSYAVQMSQDTAGELEHRIALTIADAVAQALAPAVKERDEWEASARLAWAKIQEQITLSSGQAEEIARLTRKVVGVKGVALGFIPSRFHDGFLAEVAEALRAAGEPAKKTGPFMCSAQQGLKICVAGTEGHEGKHRFSRVYPLGAAGEGGKELP